jgi:hypothetical protein
MSVAAVEAVLGIPVVRDGTVVLGQRDSEGLTLMGVPIGAKSYVQAVVRRTLRSPATDKLLAEIARMSDAQVGYALLRLCMPARATYLGRNIEPALLLDALRRFDATLIAALAALIQEPPAHAAVEHTAEHPPAPGAGEVSEWDAAMAAVWDPNWDGVVPVAFTPVQQAQAQLRQSHGGLGIASSAHRAPAAFLGRTVETLWRSLHALSPAQQDMLRADGGRLLLSTGPLVHAHAALTALRACGEATAQALSSGELLPPAWCGPWAPAGPGAAAPTDGDDAEQVRTACEALVTRLLPRLDATPAAQGAAEPRHDAPPARRRRRTTEQGPPHRQAALARHFDAAGAAAFQHALTADAAPRGQLERSRALAVWRSQAAPGAMAWTGALPSSGLHMSGAVFRETCRRHLRMERLDCGGLCGHPTCARALDGMHARRCIRTGRQVHRHNAVRNAIFALFRALCSGVLLESHSCFVMGVDPARRMDVLVAGGQIAFPTTSHQPEGGGGCDAAIDATIVDCTRKGLCAAASKDVNTILKSASLAKFNTYGDLIDKRQTTLYPAAFDQFGAASVEVHDLLRTLARRAQAAPGAQPSAYSQYLSRARQNLSVTLQRAVSQSVIMAWGDTRAVPGEPPPDVGAYARVRLLVPPQTRPAR